jgi:hypothetical protein
MAKGTLAVIPAQSRRMFGKGVRRAETLEWGGSGSRPSLAVQYHPHWSGRLDPNLQIRTHLSVQFDGAGVAGPPASARRRRRPEEGEGAVGGPATEMGAGPRCFPPLQRLLLG